MNICIDYVRSAVCSVTRHEYRGNCGRQFHYRDESRAAAARLTFESELSEEAKYLSPHVYWSDETNKPTLQSTSYGGIFHPPTQHTSQGRSGTKRCNECIQGLPKLMWRATELIGLCTVYLYWNVQCSFGLLFKPIDEFVTYLSHGGVLMLALAAVAAMDEVVMLTTDSSVGHITN